MAKVANVGCGIYCKDNAAMANRGYCSGAKQLSLSILVWEAPENWD